MSLSVVARWSCVLMSVAACREIPTAPVVIDAHLSTTELWSGGELRITATAFAPPAALPTIVLGVDTLIPHRVDDSTIAVRVPMATGVIAVSAGYPRNMDALGNVTVDGYLDEVTGPFMSGRAYWLNPTGGPPAVFASADSGAAVVDLRYGTASVTVPDSISSPDCAMSPGPSYRGPNYFVMEGNHGGTCGQPVSWQVSPTLVRADSSGIGTYTWYVMAEPGPLRWFVDWNNQAEFFKCTSLPCNPMLFNDPSGPNGVVISPTGALFSWTPQNYVGNTKATAIFDVTAMDTAYGLPAYGEMLGAAFSGGGDTLFISAKANVGGAAPQHVAAVRASDGMLLHDLKLDTLGVGHARWARGDVALDPVRPWLYIAVVLPVDTLGVPALVVIDRDQWKVLGILPASGVSGDAWINWIFNAVTLVPSPDEHLVYAVGSVFDYSVHGKHATILRFQTP